MYIYIFIYIYIYIYRYWDGLNFPVAPFYTQYLPDLRITELQQAEVQRAVRVEDLNRASALGVSAENSVNHTNDEAAMEVGLASQRYG